MSLLHAMMNGTYFCFVIIFWNIKVGLDGRSSAADCEIILLIDFERTRVHPTCRWGCASSGPGLERKVMHSPCYDCWNAICRRPFKHFLAF